jgi:hypothetical protein
VLHGLHVVRGCGLHILIAIHCAQFFGSQDVGGEEDQQPNYVDVNPLKDYGTVPLDFAHRSLARMFLSPPVQMSRENS